MTWLESHQKAMRLLQDTITALCEMSLQLPQSEEEKAQRLRVLAVDITHAINEEVSAIESLTGKTIEELWMEGSN